MVLTVTFFRTKIWLNGQMSYGYFSYIKRLNFFLKEKEEEEEKERERKPKKQLLGNFVL
jgi:hypothetical protein